MSQRSSNPFSELFFFILLPHDHRRAAGAKDGCAQNCHWSDFIPASLLQLRSLLYFPFLHSFRFPQIILVLYMVQDVRRSGLANEHDQRDMTPTGTTVFSFFPSCIFFLLFLCSISRGLTSLVFVISSTSTKYNVHTEASCGRVRVRRFLMVEQRAAIERGKVNSE